MDSDERVVAISGATGGLGRAAAAAFAADGARLGLLGTDRGRLDGLAGDLGLDEGRWAAGVGDLRDEAAAGTAFTAVTDALGPIDVLLHLVGGYTGGVTLTDVEPKVLEEMLGQHVWSTFHALRAVMPAMVERGHGRIVAVTPRLTDAPAAKQGPYGAAKSAEEALLRTAAREVAGTGVTANLIAVKAIDVDGLRDREPSPKTAGWSTPDEIVAAMRWLCSDDAASINGVRLPLGR